jgi:hypothetical protein
MFDAYQVRWGRLAVASLLSSIAAVRVIRSQRSISLQTYITIAKLFVAMQLVTVTAVSFGPRSLLQNLLAIVIRFSSFTLQVGRLACLPFVQVHASPNLVRAPRPSAPSIVSESVRRVVPDGASFSFDGCSWKLFYHLGVASVLQEQCVRQPGSKIGYAGASCGSLAAAALALDVPMKTVKEFGMAMHAAADARFLGPIGDMSRIVRAGLEALFPLDSASKLNAFLANGGTLAVSLSVWDPVACKLRNIQDRRSHFETRDELITLLLCSCYIPLVSCSGGGSVGSSGGSSDHPW